MAGLFSKGAQLTPAQQQQQQFALQSAGNFYNKYMPIQSFFNRTSATDIPAQGALEKGAVSTTARAQGSDATKSLLSRDVASGATAGSGRYSQALQKGTDATAGAVGTGLAGASSDAEKRYVQALQAGLGVAQQDQSTAMGGLNTAAAAQAQEEGANIAGQASTEQGLGTAAGLAIAAA